MCHPHTYHLHSTCVRILPSLFNLYWFFSWIISKLVTKSWHFISKYFDPHLQKGRTLCRMITVNMFTPTQISSSQMPQNSLVRSHICRVLVGKCTAWGKPVGRFLAGFPLSCHWASVSGGSFSSLLLHRRAGATQRGQWHSHWGLRGGPTGVTLPGAPAHRGFLEDSRVLLLVESVVKL